MSKCLHPVRAYICGKVACKADGIISPRLVFSPSEAMQYYARLGLPPSAMDDNSLDLPCGHCLNCKVAKRKDLSVRIAHEASMYDFNSFITLTYDDAHLPLGMTGHPTLLKTDVQLFVKRLRRRLEYHFGIKGLRYYLCGEYGSKTHRPHYHLIVFGWRPDDLYAWSARDSRILYRSPFIESVWTFGHSIIMDVNSNVAKYVSAYVTKKFERLDNSNVIDFVTRDTEDEFCLQSSRLGGIGSTWFDKYGAEACEKGTTSVRNGQRISTCAIPRYYLQRLRKRAAATWCKLRDLKTEYALHHRLPYDYDLNLRSCECETEKLKHQSNKEVL